MKCFVQTTLNCPAERVWATVQTSSLLLDVIRPLVRLEPIGGEKFPERWAEGMLVRCRFYLFGLNLGVHTLQLERIDQAALGAGSRRPPGDARRHLVGERFHGGLPPGRIALETTHHRGLERGRKPQAGRRLAQRLGRLREQLLE